MKTDVVVVGWGQTTQPKNVESAAQGPMGLMVQAALSAARKLKHPECLPAVDGIFIVKSLSAFYPDPARELAGRIGAAPKFLFESEIGGNSPQTLVNKAAAMIARNELNMALVAGAEAYVPRTPGEVRSDNALLKGIPEDYKGEDAQGVTPLEARYGIRHPIHGFPLFETALWAASGKEIGPYLKDVAGFWAGFSRAAAAHPYSWTKTPKTPEEILRPTPQNRPIAFPYTKYMNSFVTVDMGAAVILMSAEYARSHGAARGRRVYFCGGGFAKDRQPYMIDKTDFTSSPPLAAAARKALHRSGLTISDMDAFDLYSCFPCAVSIAKKMLGITAEDPRPMTLTGGLGFFGGPGNNYNLHAVATLCGRIADGQATTGMATALGWFMQKHAAGIYSAIPTKNSLAEMDREDENDFLAGDSPMEVDPAPTGRGIIETYTIVYRRDQIPEYAVIYGRTEKGLRFIARAPDDPAVYHRLSHENMVEKTVSLAPEPESGLTLAIP
ncbi:MAG: hypothetical protein HUN04_08255 [Desulfobacter sp.]|nr:MAG: hypothetical protein HUN04_08255 [Desulfobacter sp.]